MIPAEKRRSWLARQVGTLVLSHARAQNPMAVVRAAAWANRMGRLGVWLPLFLVHDVGLLLTAPRGAGRAADRRRRAARRGARAPQAVRLAARHHRRERDGGEGDHLAAARRSGG